MTHDEFVQEYNSMIQPGIDELTGRPLELEDLTPDIMAELMPLIVDMMNVNVGSVVNFDFVGNKGHIRLIGEPNEEN